MAHIFVRGASGKKEPVFLVKRLTIIGSGDAADIKIDDVRVSKIAAYISQTLNSFTLISSEDKTRITLKNQPISRHVLKDQEEFVLGESVLQFFANDAILSEPQSSQEESSSAALIAYRRILDFSQRIAQEKDIEKLLKRLLQEITILTGAERGFLVLVEDGKPTVKVSEPHDEKEPTLEIGPMSDSVVKKVIALQEPMVLSDAFHDQEFASSLSVINYRLTSVMCTPLTYQGHTFGAIYVGNDSLVNAFDEKSLEIMTLYSSQAAVLVQNALHINALKKRTETLQESLDLAKFGGMIGACHSMQAVFLQVEKVAATEISVLITGETGTGKELIACEIHNRSLRKSGPFLVLNCRAVPESLLESELFGHVRGAFLGATQSRSGKLSMAYGGTLFLDEVDNIPLNLQVKLLRAILDESITKIGDKHSETINIRIIASTHRDLLEMVKAGQFREDLLYRLNVVEIAIPPLKDRGNDVLVIANYFLQKYAKVYAKNIIGLKEEAQNALLNYHWPGNVRQLENRIKRAIIMCDHNRITALDLDLSADNSLSIMPLSDAMERFRTRYINEALERNAFNRTKTANELGVDPRTIFRHLESKKKSSETA